MLLPRLLKGRISSHNKLASSPWLLALPWARVWWVASKPQLKCLKAPLRKKRGTLIWYWGGTYWKQHLHTISRWDTSSTKKLVLLTDSRNLDTISRWQGIFLLTRAAAPSAFHFNTISRWGTLAQHALLSLSGEPQYDIEVARYDIEVGGSKFWPFPALPSTSIRYEGRKTNTTTHKKCLSCTLQTPQPPNP